MTRQRSVPFDQLTSTAASSQEVNEEMFEWSIDGQWKGSPYACGFSLISISVMTFTELDDLGYIGGFAVYTRNADETVDIDRFPRLGEVVKVVCNPNGYDDSYGKDNVLECAPEKNIDLSRFVSINKNIKIKTIIDIKSK